MAKVGPEPISSSLVRWPTAAICLYSTWGWRHKITEDIIETHAVWEWQNCHPRVPGDAAAVLQSFVRQALQTCLPALGTCKVYLQVLRPVARCSRPFSTLWFWHTTSRRQLNEMKYGVKVSRPEVNVSVTLTNRDLKGSYLISFNSIKILLVLLVILCRYFHNLVMADACKCKQN